MRSSSTNLGADGVPVEWIALSHAVDDWTGQVDGHFPIHAVGRESEPRINDLQIVAKLGMRRLGELTRPQVEVRTTSVAGCLVEGMHPEGQVAEVLAVAVPFCGSVCVWQGT